MASAQSEGQSPEESSTYDLSADAQQQQQRTTTESNRHEDVSSVNNVQSTSSSYQDAAQPVGVGPTRVPGTYPPEWLPDHETNNCMSCDSLFTLIKRRHHCRSCGKIFCGDCCRHKAKLLYLDNKEARVCRNCRLLIENTFYDLPAANRIQEAENNEPTPSSSNSRQSSEIKVQGVLKTVNQSRPSQNNEYNTSSASSTDQQLNKQVIFADGIRPGTDLSEPFPYPIAGSGSSTSGGTSSATISLVTRQNRQPDDQGSSKKNRSGKNSEIQNRNITVCDELGYLPPIVISKDAPIMNDSDSSSCNSNSLTSYLINQFRSTGPKRTIQASMESRSCPLNGIVRFEDVSGLVGVDQVVTFLLLRDYYLEVKLTSKQCCMSEDANHRVDCETEPIDSVAPTNGPTRYWCFASDGLARFGQAEIVLVIDKDSDDPCIPRDVFKIYLTLHELALRRQSLDNLGNLLFQDGLFGSRGTAGLLFVKPMAAHCLQNLIVPERNFLVALVLQRWEVPWSKVFPVRLLLRLGHKFKIYPYPLVSLKIREPVYYEVGHTIISILGDFRNFRYGINHVDGLKVMLNKATKKVLVELDRSSYQQFNKVLDSSNNEHVLAWSSYPFLEAQGHLVSVQNEEGNYETVEFYKKTNDPSVSFDRLESEPVLGASFIIFSGALKVDQSGQSAKISVVEDGLLIQIQSCTMSALRNAIHYMHHFDIDCESEKDPFNRVEIVWQEEKI